MIKDIVVNLSVGERVCPAGDYAVSIAATFGAHRRRNRLHLR